MSNTAYFAMGCFWGAEKLFWAQDGVLHTEVGYMGGGVPQPSYREVCADTTGHAETVRVEYTTPASYAQLVRVFFENHDPTQGDRQGNDVGSQYRSALFTVADQTDIARDLAASYQRQLTAAGFGPITTEITPASAFYPAEDYHQKYLLKNPAGYCPVHATGVRCAE